MAKKFIDKSLDGSIERYKLSLQSVYINILKRGGSLDRSSVYQDRKKSNWNGKNYRMYMHALSSKDYASDKEAKNLAAANTDDIARAKEVFSTMYTALTDPSYTNAVLQNPGIVNQGYHGDLNKYTNTIVVNLKFQF